MRSNITINYVIDWDNAGVLGRDCSASIRRIRESIWIGGHAVNGGEGAHFLSHVFDPFLTGNTPSTAGVHPTGKKKDRSTSF